MRSVFSRFSFSVFLILPFISFAQKEDIKYHQQADLIRKEVWNWDMPEFANRDIPEEYKTYSKVILARRREVITGSRRKSSVQTYGLPLFKEYSVTEVIREAIKINDKAALDDYSEISFQQLQKNVRSSMGKTTTTYIGIKVFKPNGTVKEINADDIVLTKNEKTEKQAKVAIPDLQVGDVLDYFILTDMNTSQGNVRPSFTFLFFDTDPILSYSIHLEIDDKNAVETRSYNEAPEFKVSRADKKIIMDVVKNNISTIPDNNLWISPYRQLPLIRVNILMTSRYSSREKGEVYKNQDADKFIDDQLIVLSSVRRSQMSSNYNPGKNMLPKKAIKYEEYIWKKYKGMPDSLISELYYLWRYEMMNQMVDAFLNADELEKAASLLSIPFEPNNFIFNLSTFYKANRFTNSIVLVTSKYGPEMKEVMDVDDYGYMVKVRDGSSAFLGAEDLLSPAFTIPYYYESSKDAVAVNLQNSIMTMPGFFDRSTVTVPGSSVANRHFEQISIVPELSKNELKLHRKTTLTGHYKSDDQKNLVLFEDYYTAERKYYGEEESLVEDYMDRKKTKKLAEELTATFSKARVEQKDAFKKEASEWFDLEVKDLENHKVENIGSHHTKPEFIFSSDFALPGLVKKAGNNFIVDIGKLQGSPLKVEESQRKRTLDIYMPFARTIDYEIKLQVPDGFTAEGLTNLNKNVENESALFKTEATAEGNTITVRIRKAYKNAYEPASNWDKLLAVIDASNEWSNSKLLLRKK